VIPQRYRDWRHEREIERLSAACREAYEAGDKAKARHFFRAMGRAIATRSPGAVRRMEERKGLRFRRSLKRRLMDAFLSGWAPSWLVTTTFRLFKLRSL
jgi:hypothetical protein